MNPDDCNECNENPLTHRFAFKGEWFYYFGNGEYSYYKTREEAVANKALYKNGEFPEYGFRIDTTELSVKVGEVSAPIKPNDASATVKIDDESIVKVDYVGADGSVKLKGLKAGKTVVKFTAQDKQGLTTRECVVTVEDDNTIDLENNIFNWEVTGIKDKVYNGDYIKQNIVVKKDGRYADFDAVYFDNLDVGTATVYIFGIGEYTGITKRTFKITKAEQPIKVSVKKNTVKSAKLRKKALTINPFKIKKAKGKLTFSKYKKGSTILTYKRLKIDKKTGKIKIKKNYYPKGTFKIGVKITAKGNYNYKGKTIIKTVKVKVK